MFRATNELATKSSGFLNRIFRKLKDDPAPRLEKQRQDLKTHLLSWGATKNLPAHFTEKLFESPKRWIDYDLAKADESKDVALRQQAKANQGKFLLQDRLSNIDIVSELQEMAQEETDPDWKNLYTALVPHVQKWNSEIDEQVKERVAFKSRLLDAMAREYTYELKHRERYINNLRQTRLQWEKIRDAIAMEEDEIDYIVTLLPGFDEEEHVVQYLRRSEYIVEDEDI
eukprot:TRINITY_DN1655_c0_g1_i1.p1 TRINITY_DN1655_c0_g1~~TRINITY_DN1655_c0_g1_i1.p1  ORF type:complete len:239 (-),score=55.28 TRINITY_DN1655_c0_g1_i1:166-849(-)